MPDDALRRAVHRATPTWCSRSTATRGAIHQLIHGRPTPSAVPRARLQRGGHHHDAVRHGGAQRDQPLPPVHGGAAPRRSARPPNARRADRPMRGDARRGTARTSSSTSRTCPRSATGPGAAERGDPRAQRPARRRSRSRRGRRRAGCIGRGRRRTARRARLDDVLDARSRPAAGRAARRRPPASCTAGPQHRRPALVDDALLAELERRVAVRAAAPARPRSPRIERGARSASAACRRWRASTPRSTARCPRSRARSRCRPALGPGVRRYGFHGLSYEYVVERARRAALERRAVIAHLGSGRQHGAPSATARRSTRRWASPRPAAS